MLPEAQVVAPANHCRIKLVYLLEFEWVNVLQPIPPPVDSCVIIKSVR